MKKLFIIAIITLLSSLSSAASVGASPGFVNFGEVQPGDSIEFDFYITTNVDEEFQVSPNYERSGKFIEGTSISTQNLSEQDISAWISFTQDSYNVNPNTSQIYSIPNGGQVSAEGLITLKIDVPPNPEPGYKLGEISLNPTIEGSGNGAGARVFGQTLPGFAFRVPGSVEKDIQVTGIEGFRIGEDSVQIIAQLRNTGSVTTRFNGGQIPIYNQDGERLDEINLDNGVLSPGEYAEIDTTWRYPDLEGGEYQIEGSATHTAGETYVSGDFVITDNIQQRQSVDEPSGSQAEGQESSAPIVMIVIISLLLATLLYMVDIGLTWIIMFSGGLAVALYVLLGPVSNALVLIPVLSIILMLYI